MGLVFLSDTAGQLDVIVQLFTDTFAASEGADEGALIGDLSRNLMQTTPENDLFVFLAHRDHTLVAAIIFSRLTYKADDRSVFVLGPVAVATDQQGQGIGQAILQHGLGKLTQAGVDVAVTYGDPTYYSKVGFEPVSQDAVAAPFDLQYPQGWLAQSLTGGPLSTLAGPCTCVPAFDDPAFW